MSKVFDTISVIGLGYIGLPTAAVIASRKIKVVGVDINDYAVETINQGKIHIVEPDLDMLVHAAVSEGYLRATTAPEQADAFIIAVPTPLMQADGDLHKPDLSFIEAACKTLSRVIKKGNLIVLESTSPVGTTEKMEKWLSDARPDLKFPSMYPDDSDVFIAYCPERVLPGKILTELVQNDRVVGGVSSKCSEMAAKLYGLFVRGKCLITNPRTAEMCKLTENSFRDVNIAFANELSIICDKEKINVWELIRLANLHPRVNILNPGPGVGGHCIAVDPWFIVSRNPGESKLIQAARQVNDTKPLWFLDKFNIALSTIIHEKKNKSQKEVIVACFGLAFKPDIDDIRESPALLIVDYITRNFEGKILVAEPNLTELPFNLKHRCELLSYKNALEQCDIALLLVSHHEFKLIDWRTRSKIIIIDACGLLQALSSEV